MTIVDESSRAPEDRRLPDEPVEVTPLELSVVLAMCRPDDASDVAGRLGLPAVAIDAVEDVAWHALGSLALRRLAVLHASGVTFDARLPVAAHVVATATTSWTIRGVEGGAPTMVDSYEADGLRVAIEPASLGAVRVLIRTTEPPLAEVVAAVLRTADEAGGDHRYEIAFRGSTGDERAVGLSRGEAGWSVEPVPGTDVPGASELSGDAAAQRVAQVLAD